MKKLLGLLLALIFSPALAQTVTDPPAGALVCAFNTVTPTPVAGQFYYVQCDSNGKLIIATSGGSGGDPGGFNTQVQYNAAGSFGGISGATSDGTTLTLIAPVLGTPASATLTNATGLPISTGLIGTGTGVLTALSNTAGGAGGFALVGTTPPTGTCGGDLAGTFPNCTLAWISRSAAQTLNIGVGGTLGGLAFVTPGTGVATAAAVNIGSAGAFVTFNGAGGTPSSMVGTNITGTAAGLTAGNVTGTGVGSLTSLAIGGATIGTNALAVTGTGNFSGALTSSGNITGINLIAASASALIFNGRGNVTSPVAGSIQNGAADVDTNAAIVPQVSRSQGALVGGTADQAGKNWTFIVSPGKGTGAGGSYIVQTAPAGSTGTALNAPVTALTINSAGLATLAFPPRLSTGYTVTTLPAAGIAGRYAYVTDQLTTCAAAGAALVGGGAVTCPVFDNGTTWVGG